MEDINQDASENPPMDVDNGDTNKLESSGDDGSKIKTLPNVTITPTGKVQFVNENNQDVIEGMVYTASWTGNNPFLFEQKSGSGNQQMKATATVPVGSIINSNNLGFRFGRASPPPPPPPKSSLTFADCGGLTKQVNFLQTAVLSTLGSKKNSSNSLEDRFKLDPPKGILFYGPPGTGKTRLAQALGNEVSEKLGSQVHFIYRKGKDIASKYFGQSSANLRDVFNEARSKKHCILFFDELDGLCPSRDMLHTNQSNVTIVTTMLGLLDELPRGKVFVIAATNRIDAIDPALRRPGRFDKYLEFLPPAPKGRLAILNIHTKNWKEKPDEEILTRMSRETAGFTGADLSKLCLDTFDEALSRCRVTDTAFPNNFDRSKLKVTQQDWDNALRKMKPSNLSVFGSTLYTPSNRFGNHLDVLIHEDCAKIEKMLLNFLEHKTKKDLSICSLYVHTEGECSSLSSVDDVIIPKVLRSSKLGSYPVYTLSLEILASEVKTNWVAKVNSAFRQALEAPNSILYIPDIQEFWNFIQKERFGMTLNFKDLLERVRGSSVLILATAPVPVTQLSPDNPFKDVLSGPDNCYEIECPSENKRREFFNKCFQWFLLARDWKLYIFTLEEAIDNAVEVTNNKHIGSIVQLQNMILDIYIQMEASENENMDEILQSMFEASTIYKNIAQ